MSAPPTTPELDITLERNSPIPLYYQLAQAIEQAIISGTLAPGDRLENELSLTSRLGLSRPTARQAIQELVRKGLLVRKRGVGTQVVRAFSRDEKLSSLYDDLAAVGKRPTTTVLELTRAELDDDIAAVIEAPDLAGELCWKVRRVRLADDVPLAVLTNYLPPRYDLTADDLEHRGLYAILRALGANLKIAHQRVGARLLTPEEADLLQSEAPAACLTMDRIAYDDTGRFVEYGRHVYRASQYSIRSSLVV